MNNKEIKCKEYTFQRTPIPLKNEVRRKRMSVTHTAGTSYTSQASAVETAEIAVSFIILLMDMSIYWKLLFEAALTIEFSLIYIIGIN